MKKQYLFSMTAAFLLAAAGCSDDLEKGSNDQGKTLDGEAVYMTVNIMTPASSGTTTKAGDKGEDPTGGENGDGNLTALEKENYVRSAVVVLYTVDGVTTEEELKEIDINDDRAKIVASAYTSTVTKQGEDKTYPNHEYSATVRINSEKLTVGVPYRVLVITNTDKEVAEKFTAGENLVETCRSVTIDRHVYSGSELGRFVMSTHQESGTPSASGSTKQYSIVTFSENNTAQGTPAKTVAWVERLSARIDYTGTEYSFDVEQGANDQKTKVATAKLLAIAPINVARHEMYIFKRVTEDNNINSYDYILLGDEKPVNTTGFDTPSHAEGENYVIEPTTSATENKKFDNEFDTGILYNLENGNSDIAFTEFDASEGSFWREQPSTTDTEEDRIICYAGENTMGVDAQRHGNSTGAIFKVKYDPISLYVYSNIDGQVTSTPVDEIAGYKEASGFYRVNDKIYYDLAAAEAEFIKTGTVLDGDEILTKLRKCFTSNDWNSMNIDDLKKALQGKKSSDDLGYMAWLYTKLEKDNATLDASTMNWAAYVQDVGFPENNTQDNQSITKVGTAEISQIEYYAPDHLCYYQYWIRHANNGEPEKMGVMEFCIVRNNVYQLAVTGINGLGMADPFDSKLTPDEGEEKGYYLDVQLYVKSWVLRLNNNIILE